MEPIRQRPRELPTPTIMRAVAIVVLAAVALYLVYVLRRPIGWIFVAGFIAIALSGPINALSSRMPRALATAVVYVVMIAMPFVIGALIVPPLLSEGSQLVGNLPSYAEDVRRFVEGNETLRNLDQDYQLAAGLQARAEALPARIGDAAQVLGNVGLGLVNSIFAFVTILILSIFMVSSGPGWARALIRLQPAERAIRMNRALHAMAAAVGNYVAGAIVQALVAGLLAFAVLSLIGMPFALPLAMLVAIFDLIPLVGATIAAVLVALVTLFYNFPTATIIWVVFSIIYQQVENSLIQPQIQRRAVAVHPFVVLIAVLFGSTLFGVLGALLAIPVAASGQIALKEWWSWRAANHAAAGSGTIESATSTLPVRPSTDLATETGPVAGAG